MLTTSRTVAERVTLPLYVVVNLGYGLSFVLTSVVSLLTSPAYGTLNDVAPIHAWGWMFVAVGLIQALALTVTHNRWAYVYALALAFLLGAVFTAVLFVGAFTGSNLWTAPWLSVLYTGACAASAVSLIVREP